ncbi:MAG: iron-sulfur cluster assembly protein [candidate division WOR-3 bacterium]
MITEEAIYAVLRTIYDPEIPVNIVDLGLIYGLSIENGNVEILMTLTVPGCPMGAYITKEVEEKIKALEGVQSVRVDITFDPPWSLDRMTEEGKNILRGMGMNI